MCVTCTEQGGQPVGVLLSSKHWCVCNNIVSSLLNVGYWQYWWSCESIVEGVQCVQLNVWQWVSLARVCQSCKCTVIPELLRYVTAKTVTAQIQETADVQVDWWILPASFVVLLWDLHHYWPIQCLVWWYYCPRYLISWVSVIRCNHLRHVGCVLPWCKTLLVSCKFSASAWKLTCYPCPYRALAEHCQWFIVVIWPTPRGVVICLYCYGPSGQAIASFGRWVDATGFWAHRLKVK